MITQGAVSASTPSPACHHDNTPYTPTLPTPWAPAWPGINLNLTGAVLVTKKNVSMWTAGWFMR
jgi:hypothetical protein